MEKQRGPVPVFGMFQKDPHDLSVESINFSNGFGKRLVLVIVCFVRECRHATLAGHVVDVLKFRLNFCLLVERQSLEALKNWFNVCFFQLIEGDFMQYIFLFLKILPKYGVWNVTEKLSM